MEHSCQVLFSFPSIANIWTLNSMVKKTQTNNFKWATWEDLLKTEN